MKISKSKSFKISLISLLFVLFAVIVAFISYTTLTVNALSDNYNLYECGEKKYNNSYVYTQFKGTVKTPVSLFGQRSTFSGTSKSAWMGSSPYNADTVTHTDVIGVTKIGGFSVGYPGGVSASTSGSSASLSYSASNTWHVDVNYTYTINSWLILATSQKSTASFKFGSTFVVVDSEGDNVDGYANYWVS